MSAPKTNLEKQERRHAIPLMGILAAAAFGVVLIVYWLFEESAESDPPTQEEVQATEPAPESGTVEGTTTTEPAAPPAATEPASPPAATDPATPPATTAPEATAPEGTTNP